MALAQERLAQALNDAYEIGMVGRNVCGTDFSVDVTLTWGAGAYIVGEETALIESLEGNRGMPRLKPPYFPAAKGLYMQPTIVNNVETLANVPWIVANGGEAFKGIGAPTSTGMRMFAVSGHVNRPGVFEVPNGTTTFRQLFESSQYCGGIRNGHSVKAFIPGGASAMWFFDEHLDLPLDKPTVDKAGSMLGSGAIVVMDDTTDMVKACWRIVRFFARESCGKCTPCREGTTWLERILKRIIDGHGRPEDLELLLDVSDSISPGLAWPPRQTTICPLGPSAVSPIASAVKRFRSEFEAYVDGAMPVETSHV
jgi:NADH-quinone oxidoreductase subunit F